MEYFGAFFAPMLTWLKEFDVHLFADFVSSVAMGDLYWPRAHIDNDAWYTVLVTIDMGDGLESGGDFCFPTHGTVLKVQSGDVLFFNPSYPHACTESAPHPNGSRLFISFYCKSDVMNAAALSRAMAASHGNAPLNLCRDR